MKMKSMQKKSLSNRNNKIKLMRQTGLPYSKIAKKFKLSLERIRQIVTDKYEFCDKHKISYGSVCPHCFVEKNYIPQLQKSSDKELKYQARILQKRDRTILTLVKRGAFISFLRDNKKYTYKKIGDILKRDHTTILHAYKN